MKNKSVRRDFIKNASLGLSGIAFSPFVSSPAEKELFNHQQKPSKKLKIVCLGAHPGDPEFGCGGTMAKYALEGHDVTFIYLTRGEAGDPTKTYAESAALRTKEAETACTFLKAKPVFAGQVDGSTILSNEKADEMEKLIIAENPDILFTQWPLDGHPDHQVTGSLGMRVWIKSKRRFPLYFYEVNTGSETMHFTPTDYSDITDVKELKKNAMFSHQSQDPVNTYNDFFKPLEIFRGLESGVKMAEAFVLFTSRENRAKLIVDSW